MSERVFATRITENTEAWGRGILTTERTKSTEGRGRWGIFTTKGTESTKGEERLIGDHSPWLGYRTQVGMSVPAHPRGVLGLFRRGSIRLIEAHSPYYEGSPIRGNCVWTAKGILLSALSVRLVACLSCRCSREIRTCSSCGAQSGIPAWEGIASASGCVVPSD